MLVRTPTPHLTESLRGYLLRLTEANGYETPRNLLTLCGLSKYDINALCIPIHRLSPLLGPHGSKLSTISLTVSDGGASNRFQLLSHRLGGRVAKDTLRLRSPAFCVDCVEETGFIDAFWDLSIAVACPIHHRAATTHCPSCGSPLRWSRPGLTTCRCGSSLVSDRSLPTGQETVDLLAIVQTKLHGTSLRLDTFSGHPVSELLSMPLADLLALVRTLGTYGQVAKTEPVQMVKSAAEALAEWPHGLHRWLHKHEVDDTSVKSLRKLHGRLFETLFKSKKEQHREWLQDEFVRYGVQLGDRVVVDARLLKGRDIHTNEVSVSALARKTGISPITLRRMGREGVVPLRETAPGRTALANITALAIKAAIERKRSFEMRAAAAYVGLPVSVISTLKVECSLWPPLYKHLTGFLKADLDHLTTEMLSRSPLTADDTQLRDCVRLADIMSHTRFYHAQGKGRFVLAYLAGHISSVGRSSDSLGDVYFRKLDVAEFVHAMRLEADNGALPQYLAARALVCDQYAVQRLVELGELESVVIHQTIRITAASLSSFKARFISLAQIARELSTSSQRLAKLAGSREIELLTVLKTTKGITSFMARADIERLTFTTAEPGAKRRRISYASL